MRMAKGAWAWLEISAKLMLECVTAGNRELKLSEQDSEVLGFVLQKNNYGSNVQTGGSEIKDRDDKLETAPIDPRRELYLKWENESTNGMETCKRGRMGTQNRFNAGSVLVTML